MIRAATLDDVPAMVALGEAFHAWAAPPWQWDRATVRRTCAECVVQDDRAAFVTDDVTGGILGVLVPSLLHGGLEAHEIALFVAPDRRGSGVALARRFMRWGRDQGAGRTVMQAWGGAAGPLYRAMGFRPVAEVWVR